MRTCVYLILFCFLSACAQARKDDSKSSEEQEQEVDDDKIDPLSQDGEDTIADQPVEVSGSFLTSVSVAEAPGVTAGFRPVGINVLSALTLERITDPVEVIEIEYLVDGQKKVATPMKKTNDGSANFHAVFEVEANVPAALEGLVVKVSISESAELLLAGPQTATPTINNPQPNLNAPPPLQNVDEHLLFVSNDRYQPGLDFRNIKEANGLCNGEAGKDSELDKFWWKAVLADEVWSIDQRQPLYGPVKNLDGDLLFSADSFSAVVLESNLQFANFGAVGARAGDLVFTGINKDGSTGLTCNSWQASAGTAVAGSPTSESDWLSSSEVECGQAMRLYCISNKIKRDSPVE